MVTRPLMSEPAINVAALLVFTCSLAGGQLLFKRAGLAIHGMPLTSSLGILIRLPALYAAGVLYGFATLLWIWILSRVPLTQAYPWVAIGMIIVPLAGRYWFEERVGAFFWPGALLVMLGLILTQIGSPSP